MIRIVGKLFAVSIVLTTLLHGAPLRAAPFTWVSSTGTSGGPCAIAQPCPILFDALGSTDAGGQVSCLNSPGIDEGSMFLNNSATIDCFGVHAGFGGSPQITLAGTGQVFKIRNLTFTGTGGGTPTAIKVTGSGTLILENCVFENFSGTALDIEPTGALTLAIKNSRVSNNTAAGVLIKPASGGSVKATFDGVTIVNNAGGLKTDTTNGAVRVDISNSIISNNANNGLAIIGGNGGQNFVNLSHDVIASNGQDGIEAIGANAAVLVDTTLLNQNAGGATVSVSGATLVTYSNNRIIGGPGSGFTGTVPLQ